MFVFESSYPCFTSMIMGGRVANIRIIVFFLLFFLPSLTLTANSHLKNDGWLGRQSRPIFRLNLAVRVSPELRKL